MNKKHSLLIPLFFALSVFSDEWIDGICNEGQGYIEFTYGEYIGGCKDERTAHGTGTFIFEDTSTNFIWMEDGTVYEGDWIDGYMQGTGTLLWLDGRTYQGYFYKSQRYGLGFEARPDGTGKFVMYDENNLSSKDYLCIGCDLSNEGKKAQFWLREEESPQQYIGNFTNGQRTGRGKYSWFFYDNYQDRDVYEGDFVEGQLSGKGKYFWPDGNVYEGDYVEGQRAGKGKAIWSDGTVYEGDWVEGSRTGKGKYFWPNGDIYEGMFKDGLEHGYGTTTLQDGTSSFGIYDMGTLLDVDGLCIEGNCLNGRGKYINNLGELYEGKWSDGKRNGIGTLTNVLENTSKKSLWGNDIVLCDFEQAKVIDKKLACEEDKKLIIPENKKQFTFTTDEIASKKINAIVFRNLHWEMSEEEIKEAMNKKTNSLCTDGGLTMICAIGINANILLLDLANARMYFECGIYNGCKNSPLKMSRILGEKLGLSGWKYQSEFGGISGQFYCAKGKAGDQICASKTIADDGTRQNGVYLAKGSLSS